ncbi:MAG: CPBP family intramembrane metalloprotease [Rhizobium sp.]|nr:CPBP family intramembrane metalloprotease [Rhizobium sp.]
MASRPDFPYYDGRPVAVEAKGWLFLLGSVAVAFVALTIIPLRAFPVSIMPALLFVAIPLIALRLVTGGNWAALFGKVGLREVALMVVFALLTIIVTFSVALGLSQVMAFTENPVSESMRAMSGAQFVWILAVTIPQLVGEELLAILPFLAVLWFCVTRLGMPRRIGIAIALLLSSLLFGAAHLPTYGWNWTQSLIVIGGARMVLTLAYIASRNLWVSAGAHILNDWVGFILTYELGHAPIATVE